jgi:hypothetical protein
MVFINSKKKKLFKKQTENYIYKKKRLKSKQKEKPVFIFYFIFNFNTFLVV